LQTIKVGILGLGRIGKVHLENLCTRIKGAEVIGAMTPSQDGQEFAHHYKIPIVTADPDLILNNDSIDAIIICSPTHTHADYVNRSAKSGKAIFCEKPLDLSINRVQQTLRTVQEANVPLMLAFNQRLDPNFAEVKDKILKGKIGQIQTIHIISRDPAPPPISYIKTSGGLFMDMTIHDFDMARHLVGAEVVEVFAKGHNLIDPAIGEAGDIDTGIVILTFENKISVMIENSRRAVYGYDQRLEVFGSLGMIKVENPLKTTSELYDESGAQLSRHLNFFMDRYLTSYLLEMESFIGALQKNQSMPITGDDGLKAMIIAEAANISVRECRPVRIDEIQ